MTTDSRSSISPKLPGGALDTVVLQGVATPSHKQTSYVFVSRRMSFFGADFRGWELICLGAIVDKSSRESLMSHDCIGNRSTSISASQQIWSTEGSAEAAQKSLKVEMAPTVMAVVH